MNLRELKKRRKQLMDIISGDGIAIIPTAKHYLRNRDVTYPFRPDSDFYYLTGFAEANAVAVLLPDRPEGEFILFCQERDRRNELWHGPQAGLNGARKTYRADQAFSIEKIDRLLPKLISKRKRIFYTMGMDNEFDQKLSYWIHEIRKQNRTGVNAPKEVISLSYFLHEMRLYKSRYEINTMRKAAEISAQAHKCIMQQCAPGMFEYQLEAIFIHETMRRGARTLAYPTIVGSGENSCILHYTQNSAELQENDLVLIDAGAEYNGYASDITRTLPINGQFNEQQKAIYEVVLSAQEAAISEVKEGNHWSDPHDVAIEAITRGLVDLGILKGRVKTLIERQAYVPYYMHRTGHWLGMDVHDVGDYKLSEQWRLLEPGMVLTVEPGLYLSKSIEGLDKQWHNIGIRIEDDVLVTKNGAETLSKSVPKTPAEIEAIMAGSLNY